MGGLGSGRKTDRPTVGQCLTVSMPLLMRARLDSAAAWSGAWSWSDGYGRPSGQVGYRCTLDGETGRLVLLWKMRDCATGEAGVHRQAIDLVSTAQPFGGRRWWFVCPRWGLRVLRLHKPPGVGGFAGQKALGLAYRSQRRSPVDRCLDRSLAARTALGGDPGSGVLAPFPLKPKWMQWRRYERMRLRAEIDEAHRTKLLLPAFARFAERAGLGSDRTPRPR